MGGFPAGSRGSGTGRLIVSIVAPALVAGAAYVLWWISDQLQSAGPLDRAAFGWLVVWPVWLAAPVIAGLAWGRLDGRAAVTAALAMGSAVAVVSAILFWQSVADPGCERPVRTGVDWIVPSLVTGVLIGAGLAVSGLAAAARVRNGRPFTAVLVGGGLEVVMVFLAIFLVGVTYLAGPGCQRPTG